MRNKTFAQVQKDLQAIADQKGKDLFDAAKTAYLAGVTITDDAGDPLSPDQIKFDVNFKAAETTTEDAVADIAKTIREEVSKALKPEPSRVRVEAPDDIVTKSGEKYDAPRGRVKFFSNAENAYGFGMFMAGVLGNEKARDFSARKGWMRKGQTEGLNTGGGFTVPSPFEADLVVLRERYGVVRRNARLMPMISDTLSWPRQTAEHTAHFVGEASAGTESTAAFDRIQLVAKKLMVLNTISSEWSEDTAIAFGEIWANDIAYAFSLKEDQCGLLGDGTSTYGGIIGVKGAFDNLGTEANSAGIYSATAAWDSITMANIQAWLSLLPAYAAGPNCKFYCHKAFYHQVLERLAFTAGGTTTIDIKGGVPVQSFMGYPVEFCQVLPNATATTQYDAFFGDLSQAAYFGDRRGITVAQSDSALNAFEQDEIAFRATERFDFVAANVGNNSATAALRVAGPITAFYRAS
jgi:HK97 family phage major capsid protein